MTVSENAPVETGGNSLAMISDLRSEGQAQPQESNEETKTAEATDSTQETQETSVEDIEKEAEARRTALLREIAMNPALTQEYAQQQAYYQQATQQEEEEFTLPFDEFSFDPNNPDHMKALIASQLQEVGGPLTQQIAQITQRFQQEEALKQQQQIQQAQESANQKTVEFLDTYVPGFSKITGKLSSGEQLTAQERAVFNEAVNAESAYLNAYSAQLAQQYQIDYGSAYQYVISNVQLRAQISQQIGPEIKNYAKELGLVAQPSKLQFTPEQKQQIEREMYVESSNAVPASNGNSFDKALKSGNTVQMIKALRES